MVRRLAAALAALSLSLLLVSPALANVPLHQATPIDWNDSSFQGTSDDCAGLNLQPGQVLWHFVLEGATSPDQTLTATFGDSFYDVSAMPPTKVVDHYVVMWDVMTDQTSLESASTAAGSDGMLNLSHICAGGPPPDVPEAPASVLLLGAGGIGILGFLVMRRRAASKLA